MPEQDEADRRSPSGEPPENESSLGPPPEPVAQPAQDEIDTFESTLLTVVQLVQVEPDAPVDNDQGAADESIADENRSTEETSGLSAPEPADEGLAMTQAVSLPDESPPGQEELAVEPEPPRPEPRRLSRGERETVDRQRQRFAACGRCGYFIADCQNQLGVEAVQTALLNADDGWVRLTVDHSFHRRIMQAYGVQLDAEFDLFDGTCPECRRRFVVENVDDVLTHLKLRV